MAKLTKANYGLLAAICSAMVANADAPYLFVSESEAKNLVENGLVEINQEIADGDKRAARATEKGVAENDAQPKEGNTNMSDANNTASTSSSFDIIKGAVLPEGRSRRASSIYPFETMEVGDSFFIPATEKRPNVAKSMGSTVSSANKRFAKEGQDGRKFASKPVKANVAYGSFTAPADGVLIKRES